MFVVGSAQQIPWEENYFDKVLSVESFYYYADQDRALAELFRVMAPLGELYILINLYRDNHYSMDWQKLLQVPIHMRSEQEYVRPAKSAYLRRCASSARARSHPDSGRVHRPLVQECRRTARIQAYRRVVADRAQAQLPCASAGHTGVLSAVVSGRLSVVSLIRYIFVRLSDNRQLTTDD